MKCPDCDSRLSEVKLEGDSWAYRCFKCGGFWIDSWSVNRLSSKLLNSWRRVGVDKMWVRGGKGMCPQDGTMLQRFSGESIPPTIAISRCVRCGKWWFPQDTLFDYKPAVEAKIKYFQWWGLAGDLKGLTLPILSILVLAMGLGIGLDITREQQRMAIEATQVVRLLTVTPSERGVAYVSFITNQNLVSIKYRVVNKIEWTEVPVSIGNGNYVAKIVGLQSGEKYILEVGGEEYEFDY